ncbi:gamma-tubulin complex component 3 homolog [Biomphalaria glabrata]|uniref:Gamma-tubulin complex component 3 homolog n=2 Tax=Biomphalaria glabrata TaxID=6526 RepID=A0A9W2YYB1_BIOGL|nr:gamma-tubulin complex component 3 homolog [Biomphalaria glabrata]KAI8743613.1 gamma-tubulin complex component 3 [Biomphalaria glabrata]
MASKPSSRSEEIQTLSELLSRLCVKLTGLSGDAVIPHFQLALNLLRSKQSIEDEDEFRIVERLKKQLVRHGREKDAAHFVDLHRKLQSQMLLRNRSAVLKLFQKLASLEDKTQQNKVTSDAFFSQGLPSHLVSTPNSGIHVRGRLNVLTGDQGRDNTMSLTGGSSGISSIRGKDLSSQDPTPVAQSFMPSHLVTPALGLNQQTASHAARSRTIAIFGRKPEDKENVYNFKTVSSSLAVAADISSNEITQQSLLKDLVYVLQGVSGRWIKFDVVRNRMDLDASIPKCYKQEIGKLSESGWLYIKIKSYIDQHSTDKAFGLVGQSFCAALHQELTEYLRLISVLEAQLEQEVDPGLQDSCSHITLAQLLVWTYEPLQRLKWLGELVDTCKGKKGGALTSTIFSYTHHGDTSVKSLITHLLTFVSQPIYATLLRWMYDGELDDAYHEFFVASDPQVKNDQLWHDKYSLRKTMIPSFITMDQASRILLTGKSINFLRQVCEDRTPTKGREVAMNLDLTQASSMFSQDQNSDFQKMLDSVYELTSQHLLDVLQTKYKFLEHLKAMRRYLLLGQGDFIRHLMDLLEEDLAKPAGNLYLHNLSGILEIAIRATNAQFDSSDILRRLDVRLLDVSPGDTGWDVFSLEYRVDGPIRTVFTPECKVMYLRVFNFMWRAKRMEYVLAQIWKNQMCSARQLKTIPELSPILHTCHMITSTMVHFIKQVQYYINFEVLECAWDELLTKVYEAKDLDYIIAAHQVFLDTVLSRCLLNEKSREILQLLRTLFDLIIEFETAQGVFFEAATSEVFTREAFDKSKKERTRKGEWETNDEIERAEKSRRNSFLTAIIPSTRAKLQVVSSAYQDTVNRFLKMVASHPDASLRFLCFRLDFNEHYKVREPRGRLSFMRAN